MGYDVVTMTAHARLSCHNDERDERDRQAWESFLREVAELAKTPEFECLDIEL